MEPSAPAGRNSPRRWILLSAALYVALLAACAVIVLLWRRGTQDGVSDAELLADERLRREVVARLVESALAENDAHPDADVVRTLIPSVERADGEFAVRTNAMGMRERDYVLPKPPGLVRVVLLGDSFVFGARCAAEDRLGVILERELGARRAAGAPAIEVLHLGVASWSLGSECAWLRRQLDRLLPDLVVHVTTGNDLNDVSGVRGFGALASFTPEHPERADALVGAAWGRLRGFGAGGAAAAADARSLIASYGGSGLLPTGLGWESRSRFAAARWSVLELAADLARLPGAPPYLLVGHWGEFAAVLHEEIGRNLAPQSVLYLPLEFWRDQTTWVGANDNHWNVRGHEQMARVLFGTIRARGWLPELALSPWPEAEEEARSFEARGLAFARRPCEEVARLRAGLLPAIDLTALERDVALQIHGGVDDERLVSPYASLLLAKGPSATSVRVTGRALPDSVLDGAEVQVWVEDVQVGTIVLRPGAPIDFRAELPPALRGEAPLDVRLTCDDYVYRGDDLRHCVAFELSRVALE